MRRPLGRNLVLAALVLLPILVGGCGSADSAKRSNLDASVGNRKIKAAMEGTRASIANEGFDAVAIEFDAGKLVLDKTTIRLNGEVLGQLAADARRVSVDFTAGQLTIIADGVPVVSKPIGN